ncbi:Uma2 family endonuclease [Terriglobus sp.]|uniref:Uma2 family endonuclease n=1 Tax=Terriglobus sp. TaxID=1889013 RepID=UPI003B001EC6
MELTFAGLPLPLRITPPTPLSEDDLMRFSSEHKGFPVELDSNGDILIMSPTGIGGSDANVEIVFALQLWNREMGYPGTVTDSNGGYRLPDGSVRAPDAGWIKADRLQHLTREQRKKFGPGAPDFVVELRSPSDSLTLLKEKMQIWMRNGVHLAWLIDPETRTVAIYRPGREPERLDNISQVAGEGPVAGFVLPLDRIFA